MCDFAKGPLFDILCHKFILTCHVRRGKFVMRHGMYLLATETLSTMKPWLWPCPGWASGDCIIQQLLELSCRGHREPSERKSSSISTFPIIQKNCSEKHDKRYSLPGLLSVLREAWKAAWLLSECERQAFGVRVWYDRAWPKIRKDVKLKRLITFGQECVTPQDSVLFVTRANPSAMCRVVARSGLFGSWRVKSWDFAAILSTAFFQAVNSWWTTRKESSSNVVCWSLTSFTTNCMKPVGKNHGEKALSTSGLVVTNK